MAKPALLTPEEIDLLEPTFIGPTCQKGTFGHGVLPARTLGCQIASRRLSGGVDEAGPDHVVILLRPSKAVTVTPTLRGG